jgi:hypothetical protein
VFYFLNDEIPTANKDDDVSDTGNTHSDSVLPYATPFEGDGLTRRGVTKDDSSESSEDELEIDHTQQLMESLKLAPSMQNVSVGASSSTTVPVLELHMPTISPKDYVSSLLDALIEEGNVQMCVLLILTLKQEEDFANYPLQDYMEAYIDLLHRYQLFAQATTMMNACEVAAIKDWNSQNTTFYTSCHSCTTSNTTNIPTPSKCPKCSTPLTKCSFW